MDVRSEEADERAQDGQAGESRGRCCADLQPNGDEERDIVRRVAAAAERGGEGRESASRSCGGERERECVTGRTAGASRSAARRTGRRHHLRGTLCQPESRRRKARRWTYRRRCLRGGCRGQRGARREPRKMRKGERDAQRDMVANASCSTMPKSSMSDEYDVVVMPPPT